MGFGRKVTRKNKKGISKIQLENERAANMVWTNANSVAALLEKARPKMEAKLRRDVIRYEFLLNLLALHDVFGFGLERSMRLYKRTLAFNMELARELADDEKIMPIDMLIKTVNDEFHCDIGAKMEEINNELESEEC